MTETFDTFLGKVEAAILTPIITLLALGAFVLFVWGVVQFIAGSADEEKRKTGQMHMIWGIVGLGVLAAFMVGFITAQN